MEEPDSGSGALRRLAVRAGIYAATFFGGALLAFVYSYMPLHSAKDWKIDYLEERGAAKDVELEATRGELASLEADSAERPDAQTFKVLQDELAVADKTVKRLEKHVARLERRTKELERSRNNWKAKHAEAEEARAAAVDRASLAEAGLADAAGVDSVPAAPAPAGSSIVIDDPEPRGRDGSEPEREAGR